MKPVVLDKLSWDQKFIFKHTRRMYGYILYDVFHNWYFNLCTVATLSKCSCLLRSLNTYEGVSVHLTERPVNRRNQGDWRRRSVHADGQGRTSPGDCASVFSFGSVDRLTCFFTTMPPNTAKSIRSFSSMRCDQFSVDADDLFLLLHRMSWLWRYVLNLYH